MSTLSVLDHTGDTKIEWSAANADEVSAARDHFDKMKKKGYLAYRVDGDGEKTREVIRHFDPAAEQIVMAPQLVGG